MKRNIFLVVLLVLVLALAVTVPVFAGGWAVITLDELPGQVVANEPLQVGFMVRQHGVRPTEGLKPVIYAQPPGFGKTLTFAAEEQGETGHYIATILLPQAGEWTWSIEAFGGPQPMPALTVLAAVPLAENPARVKASAPVLWPQWLATSLGAAGVLAGLVILLRRKGRWAIALILAGLIVSAGSIVLADQPEAESEAFPQGEMEVSSAESSLSQAELGRDLFLAKGCVMCHSHNKTNQLREFGVDIGPDLTNVTASPEYLRLWLKDPSAVKSTATMPTLGLSDTEIEALIAFINDK